MVKIIDEVLMIFQLRQHIVFQFHFDDEPKIFSLISILMTRRIVVCLTERYDRGKCEIRNSIDWYGITNSSAEFYENGVALEAFKSNAIRGFARPKQGLTFSAFSPNRRSQNPAAEFQLKKNGKFRKLCNNASWIFV